MTENTNKALFLVKEGYSWVLRHSVMSDSLQSAVLSCSCSSESDSLRLDRLSMGFFRQEYWNGLPFPPPGDLPTQGSNSVPPDWQVDCLRLSYLGSPNILLIGLLIY